MAAKHPVFEKIGMEAFGSNNLDSILDAEGSKILFLWGYNCPNCDVAKRSLEIESEEVKKLPIRWFHCNVYEDFDISTRFSLHGIPVFFLYEGSKKLGKITSYPGFEPFIDVVKKTFAWKE